MPRPALALALLVVIAVHADTPDAIIPGWGVSVGGTVVSSGDGAIVVGFAGTPLPGPGMPVTLILDAKRFGDGSYRLNAISADVR